MSRDDHGSESTYNNWKCRCDACRAANTRYLARRKAERVARLAVDPSLAEHGRASTYNNWGCRCEPCTTAWAIDSRERYRRKRSESPPRG